MGGTKLQPHFSLPLVALLQILVNFLLLTAMARPIPSPTSFQNLSFLPLPAAAAAAFLILAILSIISLVSFLCASHRATKSQRLNQGKGASNRRLGPSLNTNLSSKALLLVKMISWRKEQAEGEEEEDYEVYGDDDDAVWKKTIMMGERCRPLDFSGKILYDSQGNLLPSSPNRKEYGTLSSSAAQAWS